MGLISSETQNFLAYMDLTPRTGGRPNGPKEDIPEAIGSSSMPVISASSFIQAELSYLPVSQEDTLFTIVRRTYEDQEKELLLVNLYEVSQSVYIDNGAMAPNKWVS